MCDESCQRGLESLPLPKGWAANGRNSVLNAIALVRIALLAGREFLIEEGDLLTAKPQRLEAEVAMLREELRINGARMGRSDPHRRPQYSPVERMAILEQRAMRLLKQGRDCPSLRGLVIHLWWRHAYDHSSVRFGRRSVIR